MTGNNKLMTALLVTAIVGVAFGIVMTVSVSANLTDDEIDVLHNRLEKVSISMAEIETVFGALSADIRQLNYAVNNLVTIQTHSQQTLTKNEVSQANQHDEVSAKDAEEGHASDNNNTITTSPEPHTDQKLVSVNTIVDKLRARDLSAYPNFPSLMTSPEMAALSPHEKDLVMEEVARMFESRQLDPTFFPQQ